MKGGCKIQKCNEFCVKCYSFYYFVNRSEVPLKYIRTPIQINKDDIDYPSYERMLRIGEEIDLFVNEGNNLLIKGSRAGSGKTFWALKLMQQYFNKVSDHGFKENVGVFVSEAQIMDIIEKNRFSKDDDILSRFYDCNLLVLDDIGIFNKTDYQMLQIYRLIDYRVVHEKTTIYTCNLVTVDEYLQALGERLYSRIVDTSTVIELKGESRRVVKW